MKTSPQVTASALIQGIGLRLAEATIACHGLTWAARYYAKKGIPLWQFVIFAGLKTKGLS